MSLGPRSDHLVCTSSICPTSCDPYSGRILCRCYQQMQDTRSNYQPNAHMLPPTAPPTYSSMFPQNYLNLDPKLPATSSMQAPPRLDSSTIFPPTTTLPQYPATTCISPSLTSPTMSNVDSLDTLLKSQVYNYMNSMQYSHHDLNGARRKNATRESTSALKAWLKEHKKNPYPTKAEKVMLAIVTKMSLTQISTWFANARRRMKKENGGELKTDNADNSSDEDSSNTNDSSKNGAHPISTITQAANGFENEVIGVQANPDFTAAHSSLPVAGHSPGITDPLLALFASQQDPKQPPLVNSQTTVSMEYGLPNCPSDPAANMYQQGPYNSSNYSASDFTANGTGNYTSNLAYDSIANYFKQHPEFSHEYNSAGVNMNSDHSHLPSDPIQQSNFPTDSSAIKHVDNGDNEQKSNESSPSSVKSKIWSISELLSAEHVLPQFEQSVPSAE